MVESKRWLTVLETATGNRVALGARELRELLRIAENEGADVSHLVQSSQES